MVFDEKDVWQKKSLAYFDFSFEAEADNETAHCFNTIENSRKQYKKLKIETQL